MLIALTVIGSLSTLLTFSTLWQIKEWRWDRLQDHFQEEGAFHTLVSPLRAVLGASWIAVGLLLMMLTRMGYGERNMEIGIHLWELALPFALAALSIVQIASHRQPTPVWTQKAKIMVGLSMLITLLGIIFFWLHTSTGYDKPGNVIETHPLRFILWLAPYVQPLVVVISWIILWPVDHMLKTRIMHHAATLRKEHPDLTVIGITGSVGKTTTKELIACALGDAAIATPAYVNSEIGVARWITSRLRAPADQKSQHALPQIFIVEMGAYRLGEITKLCAVAQPNLGVMTFVGSQHIALFGSQERLISAKSELLKSLPANGRAFLNVDSALTAGMKSICPCPMTTVSTGGSSDMEALDIEETSRGIKLRIGTTAFTLPLHGTQNAGNILLAVAVAEHLGVQRNVISNRLARFHPLAGTFSVEEKNRVTILNDTHNCSPESASAAIRWAESQPAAQKILLTSGIIEQGRETVRVHRDLGAQSAQIFDRVIFTNKKFAQIFEQGYGKKVEMYSKNSIPVGTGTLLVALGRVPQSAIEKLLPHSIL